MRTRLYLRTAALLCFVLVNAKSALSQRHELGLTLGRFLSRQRDAPGGALNIGGGTAFQANYGYRLLGKRKAQLWGETHFLASPLQEIASANRTASRDFASLYVLPGIRVKFAPGSRVSPYAAIGGGYALFEQSLSRIDGTPNGAARFLHRGALGFGGGLDVRVWRFVSARWELRDLYSGNPGFNTPVTGSGFHNVVSGGGFVLRWGAPDR